MLLARMAAAQSDELLDAVRVRDAEVAKKARAELDVCVRKGCPAVDRLSLLVGYLELSDGAPSDAVTQLSSHPPPAGLEAFYLWYLGEAQAYMGVPAKARATLLRAQRSAPKWLSRKIELRIAELDLALGHAAQARSVLEAAASAKPSAELLLSRALARSATGDNSKARADLRLIAIRYPTHPHASIAVGLLEKAGPLEWTEEEQLARAQGRLAGGDSGGCLATLAQLKEPLGQRVVLLKGQALLASGRDAEGVEALELAAKGKSPGLAMEALTALGRRLMRRGDNAAARNAFLRAETTFPREGGSDEAGYLAAWLAMSAGDDGAAAAAFETFELRHPESRKRDEARWFRGFTLLRRGALDDARSTFRSLVADFPRSQLVPQATYWATRAAQLEGTRDAGPAVDLAAEYRALIESSSASLYARLAVERLRELGVDAAEPLRVKPEELSPKTPKRLALAAALVRAGLLVDADEEVEAALGSVTGPDDALVFGHALQAMGEFGAAHALAARYLWGAVYTMRAPRAVGLMYPRAWRSTVERWAATDGVDPFFCWAIMRRESAFRPGVTSFADARGLMQLIPPTARQIASQLKAGPIEPDELYAPDTNVKLATWYLSQLFRRLTHPGLVAAAYNGGPGPVVRWLERRGAVPLDQWIEEIPYKETRGYVKQVIADFYIYQALYGEAVAPLSLVLPAPKNGVDF